MTPPRTCIESVSSRRLRPSARRLALRDPLACPVDPMGTCCPAALICHATPTAPRLIRGDPATRPGAGSATAVVETVDDGMDEPGRRGDSDDEGEAEEELERRRDTMLFVGVACAHRAEHGPHASGRTDARMDRSVGSEGGGDEGTRTPDPRDANAVLSQLSYIPTGGGV